MPGFNEVLWREWTYGMTYYNDENFDGQFDEILTREDLWPNSDWVLEDEEVYLVYETYSDVTLVSTPIYNTTAPDYDPDDPDSNQIIGYESEYMEERGNSLEENLTIYLPKTVTISTDENGDYLKKTKKNSGKYKLISLLKQFWLIATHTRISCTDVFLHT